MYDPNNHGSSIPARSTTGCWPPLDGSPATLARVAEALGVDCRQWHFVDVLELDADSDSHTTEPSPCLAWILLYPTSTTSPGGGENPSEDVDAILVHQLVGGTCGSVVVLNAIVNNLDSITEYRSGSLLDQFVSGKRRGKTRETCAAVLSERLLQSPDVACVHQSLGDHSAAGIRQGRHFVTFCVVQGTLVELDGRQSHPIHHGPSSPTTFRVDASRVIRKRMAETPTLQHSFSLVALVPTAGNAM